MPIPVAIVTVNSQEFTICVGSILLYVSIGYVHALIGALELMANILVSCAVCGLASVTPEQEQCINGSARSVELVNTCGDMTTSDPAEVNTPLHG